MQSLCSASVGHSLQLQRVKVVDNANAILISCSDGLYCCYRPCPALNYLFGCGTSELLSIMCIAYHAKATLVAMHMEDLCVYLPHMPSFSLHIPTYAPFPNRKVEMTFGADIRICCKESTTPTCHKAKGIRRMRGRDSM